MLPNGTLLASDLKFRVARVPLTVERAISAIDNKHTTPSAAAPHPHTCSLVRGNSIRVGKKRAGMAGKARSELFWRALNIIRQETSATVHRTVLAFISSQAYRMGQCE